MDATFIIILSCLLYRADLTQKHFGCAVNGLPFGKSNQFEGFLMTVYTPFWI
jgi:hypothetical protein